MVQIKKWRNPLMAKASATLEALMKGKPYKKYHHCYRLSNTSDKIVYVKVLHKP